MTTEPQCTCQAAPKLIFPCSGASDVGGLTDRAARQMTLDLEGRMTIEQVQAAMLCFGMIAVGGNAPAFQGATVLSTKDDIGADTLGLDTAKKLGARVAEMALRLASKEA